jgi:hypothetical protein
MKTTSHFYLSDKSVINMLIISSVITLFLFFIDESAFNYNWMHYFWNWILFVIYVLILTFIQLLVWLISKVFSKVLAAVKKEN